MSGKMAATRIITSLLRSDFGTFAKRISIKNPMKVSTVSVANNTIRQMN